MANATLSANTRAETGKGAARKLRQAGNIPAVIYGHNREPQSLVLNSRETEKLVKSIPVSSTAIDLSIEDWDRTFAVNTRGVFFAAQAAARLMMANGAADRAEARIVNIASIASHTVLPGLSAYNASKAATAMLTRSLAREWSRRGIAVNALCPGYIETDINSFWWGTDGGQKQLKLFPRRRLMEATDLDAAFMMLCGPAARAIAGSIITIDDGQTLPGGG